jgi:hypothetical protein
LLLHQVRALDDVPTQWEVSIGLEEYAGPPITAIQFRLIADPALAIQSLQTGPDLGDTTEWKLYTHLKPKREGVSALTPDTMNVVLLSVAMSRDLVAGTHLHLLRCVYRSRDGRLPAGARNEIRIAGVVAASAKGENAQVVPGPGASVTAVKR